MVTLSNVLLSNEQAFVPLIFWSRTSIFSFLWVSLNANLNSKLHRKAKSRSSAPKKRKQQKLAHQKVEQLIRLLFLKQKVRKV